MAEGLVDRPTLDAALQFQRTEADGNSIGHILIERQAVTRKDIYRVIRGQIQNTIFDLVSWRHGYFQFEVDELRPSDDFGVSPQKLLDNLDLNTQMLVLEATRHFDEKHRDAAAELEGDETGGASKLALDLDRAGLGREGQKTASPLRGLVGRRTAAIRLQQQRYWESELA